MKSASLKQAPPGAIRAHRRTLLDFRCYVLMFFGVWNLSTKFHTHSAGACRLPCVRGWSR